MDKRRLAKILSFRYNLLAAIFIIVAGGLVLLPKYKKHEGILPEVLLNNAISPERYISSDELASKIIKQDPSFLLIDVRDEESFGKYNIQNSINIPLKKLLDEDSKGYLNQSQFDVILVSNDNFNADEAWLLCNRLGFKNIFVLKGGINNWFNTIINPVKPTENMPAKDFNQYTSRKAASMYFGVVYPEQGNVKKQSEPAQATPKVVIPLKKKKVRVAGGC